MKNFYLNKGFYDVVIDSSFAKLINQNEFELIYNIKANDKYYFNNLSLDIPIDFNKNNFKEIFDLFDEIKNKPYSINIIEDILEKIDKITLLEQFQSITSIVDENIVDNKINLNFVIKKAKTTMSKK